jgi:arsenate reductase (glutaredoxin)
MLEKEPIVTIYYNSRCSKCRESLCILEEKGVEVEVIEYMKTPLSRDELEKLVKLLNIAPFDLIRTGEEIYKIMLSKRSKQSYDWIGAILKHPQLMQRPIVVKNKRAVIGRPPQKALDLQ